MITLMVYSDKTNYTWVLADGFARVPDIGETCFFGVHRNPKQEDILLRGKVEKVLDTTPYPTVYIS